MQTIPQPCKARGGLDGLEWGRPHGALLGRVLGWPLLPVSLLGLGWRQVEWSGVARGGNGLARPLVFSSQGASASSTQWPRLPAVTTAGQGQQDPHCGLGRSQLWPLQVPEPCGKSPEPVTSRRGFVSRQFCIRLPEPRLPCV